MAKGSEQKRETGSGKYLKYSLAAFRRNCVPLFGISESTFDSIAGGLEPKGYSVYEIKKYIQKWKDREVM